MKHCRIPLARNCCSYVLPKERTDPTNACPAPSFVNAECPYRQLEIADEVPEWPRHDVSRRGRGQIAPIVTPEYFARLLTLQRVQQSSKSEA